MTLTLGNWLALIICFALITALIIPIVWINTESKLAVAFALMITLFVFSIIAVFLSWYNSNTASGIRAYKDFQSEMANGINREITITAEDGREIFHYEGKVDVESNHTDNYIKFESEDGKRYIIYYGIQDTITIIEK